MDEKKGTVAHALETADPSKINFSFEYFPPRTADLLVSLLQTMWRMSKQGPLFMDVTWGAGGSTSEKTLRLVTTAQRLFGVPLNMHLTCTNMPAQMIYDALQQCEDQGIRNICALRGDPPAGQAEWKTIDTGFECALDLVRYINKTGKDFCLSVAGYPEGHPNAIKEIESEALSGLSPEEKSRLVRSEEGKFYVCNDADFEKEIAYLKEKVDAGSSVIISQLFYDVEAFLNFVKKCRQVGIKVPILPGIMPIQNAAGFKRMTKICKTRIPTALQDELDAASGDEAAFSEVGTRWVVNMCRTILDSKMVNCLHFYTLNKEGPTYSILKQLGWKEVDTTPMQSDFAKISDAIRNALADMLAAQA